MSTSLRPPQNSLVGNTTIADWQSFWRGGPKLIFDLLFGLHRCFYRLDSGTSLVTEEWLLWVEDVGAGLREILTLYVMFFFAIK